MDFRTPKRRKTRQKSGFNVAGETPGSECKIRKSSRLLFKNNTASFQIYKKSLISKPLFLNEIGLIFFGGYIKPEKEITIYLTIKYTIDSVVESETREISIEANKWNKFGIIAKVNIIKPTKIDNINCEIKIISETNNIGYLDLFGLSIDAINYEYFLDNDVEDIFWQKNNIYIPEISYTNFDGIFLATFKDKSIELKNGEFIILKSCNRCSRFLPIDILNERNTLSFSNHCVKKYPCTHNAFSKYKIIESDYSEIPKELSKNIEGDKIISYFGHQLECKSCKKFFVNAPLNPLRNSTQHREDSLRRRCIEVLVDTLLKREWIYHKFRIKEKKEFDRFIWNKFDKKCFKCNKELESPREMDLDHTMPLASFWPLDESATCLCKKCNSLKSDKFPVDFYSKKELINLAKITKLPIDVLSSRSINKKAVEKLIKNIEWFFDIFLAHKDYQKVRNGKRASDLIYKAIMKQIKTFYNKKLNLIEIYKKKTSKLPKTISI